MALFSFVKSAGQLVGDGLEKAVNAASDMKAGAEAKAAVASEAEVEKKIKASNLKPRDLSLKKVDDETIKIYAVVDSADERDDLLLIVGNTPGVSMVEDAIKVRPAGLEEIAAPAPKFYTVKSGDTLGDIAKAQLGDESRYMDIFNANRNILSNPDAIDVGQTLKIPQTK